MNDKKTSDKEEKITISGVFGEIVWLMAQSSRHRYSFFLADLEWLVMPPVMMNQFRIFHQDGKPVGAAFWAFVSEETDARLAQGASKIKQNEWKNGNQAWLIDIITPFGHADGMIEDLKKTALADSVFKSFQTNEQGERKVVEYVGVKKQN